MKIKIKVASSKKEKQKAREIRKTVFIEEQGVPENIEVDEYEVVSTHFIAYLNGLLVATGRFRIKNNDIKFERIATLKEHRGKGIGQKLMKFMQEYALTNYSDYLPMMHAQKTAISFYERIGWKSIGKLFKEGGIIHQKMIFLGL